MHSVPDSLGFGIQLDDDDGLKISSEADLWTLSDAEVLEVLRRARALRKARAGLRQKVIARDNGRCRYCGSRTFSDTRVDWVVPLAQGGLTELDNLVSACELCHAEKSGRTLKQSKMTLLDPLPA
jgi:hypothetical protein